MSTRKVPVPEEVRKKVKKGLTLLTFHRKGGGVAQKRMAEKLFKLTTLLSYREVKFLHSFFMRERKNVGPEGEMLRDERGDPVPAEITWLLYGGWPGYKWASDLLYKKGMWEEKVYNPLVKS